MMCVNMSVCLN